MRETPEKEQELHIAWLPWHPPLDWGPGKCDSGLTEDRPRPWSRINILLDIAKIKWCLRTPNDN